MKVIESLILCDECGEQCSGDDRWKDAAWIRRDRKKEGWIQIGKKDYCPKCVVKLRLFKPLTKQRK